jgi:RHS repeat-associated protein
MRVLVAQVLIGSMLVASAPAPLASSRGAAEPVFEGVPAPVVPRPPRPDIVAGTPPRQTADLPAEAARPKPGAVQSAVVAGNATVAAVRTSPSSPEARRTASGPALRPLTLIADRPTPGIQKDAPSRAAARQVQEVRPPLAPHAEVAHAPDEYTAARARADERAVPAPARLSVHPETLRFALTPSGAVPASQRLEIAGNRGAGVRFEIADPPAWLVLDGRTGQAGLKATAVLIAVDGRKVAGSLSGQLEIRNLDDPTDVRRVAVEVERVDRPRPLRSYDADGRLQRVVRPDGGVLDYDYDARGHLVRVRYPDGTAVAWSYDDQGRRTSRSDVQGTTVFRYDEQGRLDTVYNPGFEPLRYGYDAKGRLTRLTLPGGRVVSYEYDDADRLLSVRGDLGVTRYGYDPVSGRLAERTLPNGIVTGYAYDAAGRLVEVTHRGAAGDLLLGFSWQLDDQGRPVSETRETPQGRETKDFSYDAQGRIASVAFPDGRTDSYEYDAAGRRSRRTETRGAAVAVVDSLYDDLGRLVRAGDETFDYDVNGDLVRRAAPGRTVEYTWDFEGRLRGFRDGRRQVSWTYDGDGRRIAETVDGRRTLLLQDESGWIGQALVEAGEGGPKGAKVLRSRLYGFEPLGVEGKEGEGSFYLYDHPLRGAAALASPAGAFAETFASDPFGAPLTRPAEALPPFLFAGAPYEPVSGLVHLNGSDARDYDPALGAFLQAGSGDGSAAPSSDPGAWADRIATGAFSQALVRAFHSAPPPSSPDRRDDPKAGRTSGQDPPRQFTILQSNALSPASPVQNRSRALPSPYQMSADEGSTYRRGELPHEKAATPSHLKLQPEYLPFAKTAAGLLPASQTLQVSSTDGQALSFTLTSSIPWLSVSGGAGTTPASFTVTANPAGLTEAGSPYVGDITLTNTADPTDVRKVRVRLTVRSTGAAVTLRSFDANGNLRRVIKPDGSIIDYQVDALGRVTQVSYPDQPAVTYAYDGNNNRISMTDQRGTTYYQYDRQNRLTGTFTPLGTNFIPVYYGYDNAGHLTSLATPDGRTVLYTYDADGRMTRVTDGTDVTSYTYNTTTGLLASQTLPNGITTTYTYDVDGRLTDVVHKSSGGALLMSFHYVLNAVGQKTSTTRQTPSGSEITSYTYDSLGRLASVTYPDSKQVSYTYDKLGNRLTQTTVQGGNSTVVNYVYDKDNRLLKAGNEVFSYDGNGNLIRRSSPDRTVSYGFDARNLLTVVDDGSHPVTFEYDGDGNRIAKGANGQRVNYVNDSGGLLAQVLVEADAAWQVLRSYSYGVQRIGLWSPTSSQFYLQDANSVAAITDTSANLSEVYSYDTFGTPFGNGGKSSYLFDGEAFDAETSLIFLRARYYESSLGRFVSNDPVLGSPENPKTYNYYLFAANDPVNLVDHDGREPEPPRGNLEVGLFTPGGHVKAGGLFNIYEEAGIGVGAQITTNSSDPLIGPSGTLNAKIGLEILWFKGFYDTELHNGVQKSKWGLGFKEIDWSDQRLSVSLQAPTPYGVGLKYTAAADASDVRDAIDSGWNYMGDLAGKVGSYLYDTLLSDDPYVSEVPYLGGVDLNKTADLLLSVQDVTGATFDVATGQVVLLGKNDVTLPPLDMNHVAVAVQSEYAGQDPGVSIDLPIVNNQMPVRYEGQTRNTVFGDIMFQADRTLKILSLGKDNVTGQTVTSSVPGYKNMLQRRLAAGCNSMPTTTRMWFQPKQVRLVPSTDGKSMVFDAVSMELLYESKVGNQVVSDPVAAAFADHFTQNYEAFAAEWPILKKLEQLGKVVAVIKWIKDNHIPIDLSFLSNFPITAFTTNTTTPAVTVVGANGCLVTLQGGVTYVTPNQYLTADPAASAALAEAIAHRPNEGTFKWSYQPAGSPGQATAVSESLTRSRRDGNIQFREVDLSSPLSGGGRLALVRTYSSFLDHPGPLGPGWSVLPAELRFPVDREIFTFGSANLSLSLYGRIWVTERNAGREDAYDLLGVDSSNLPIYQRADTPNILRQQSDGTFLLTRLDGSKAVFRADGKPLSLTDRNGNAVTFTFDTQITDRLLHLDSAGQTITLTYNAQGRLTQAAGPGSRQVGYGYDAQGRLTTFTDYAARSRTYGYDAAGNLISATDATGQTVFSSSYDDYNRTPSRKLGAAAQYGLSFDLTAGKTTVTDPFGKTAQRTFERRQLASPSGLPNEVVRPTQNVDALGNRVTTLWANDAFGPRTVTDAQGAMTQLAWDNRGHLTTVQDPLGKQSQRYYDWRDRLVAVQDPEGLATGYGYDDKNNLTTVFHDVDLIVDASGNLTSFNYDPANLSTLGYDATGNLIAAANPLGQQAQVVRNTSGQPTRVTTPASVVTNLTYDTRSRLSSTQTGGQQVTYGYDTADQITSIATAAGTTSLTRDAKGRVTKATDALGHATSYAYDADSNLTSVTDPAGNVTTYTYDALGHLLSASLPNGTSNAWEYDEFGRPVAALTGLGAVAPVLALSAQTLDFGTVAVGNSRQLTLTLLNQGTAALTVSGITASAPFSVAFSGPATIQPGRALQVVVTFTPTDGVTSSANLSITSNDPATPLQLVALTGGGARKIVNLQATPQSDGILLTWDSFSPGSQSFGHFNVYRSTSPIPGDVAGLTPFDQSLTSASATSFEDTLATPGTSYYYAVTPVYANGAENKNVDPTGPVTYFSSFGPLAADLPVATTTQSEDRPAIAYNSTANEYLVVFERQISASNTDIYGQRVTKDGTLLGSTFVIANTTHTERHPRLAYNPNANNYLVVYEYDASTNGSNFDIQGRLVTAGPAGTSVGGAFNVGGYTVQELAPEVVFNTAAREYVVVFQMDANSDGKSDIIRQRVSAAGTLPAVGYYLSFPINGAVINLTTPRLAYNSTANEYMVAFEVDAANNGSNIEIWETRVKPDLTLVDNTVNSIAQNPGNDRNPVLTYDSTHNEYLATWEYDSQGNGTNPEVACTKVNNIGLLIGVAIGFGSSTDSERNPRVVYNQSLDDFVIVWENGGATPKIQASRIHFVGSPFAVQTWAPINLSTGTTSRVRPDIGTSPQNNTFLAVWEQDAGSGNFDIRSCLLGTLTPTLQVSPASLTFTGSTVHQTLTITNGNSAGGPLQWTATPNQPWLTAQPGSGSTTSSVAVDIAVNRTGLAPSTYTATVHVASNNGSFDVPVTLTMANQSPATPSSPSPADGAVNQATVSGGLGLALSWQGSDPDGDALTWDVYFDTDAAKVTALDPTVRRSHGQSAMTFQPSGLTFATTYAWRVVAFDTHGSSTAGPVWRFTTAAISAPVLVPVTPDPTRNARPVLAWQAVTGAASYHLQVAANSGFNTPLVDATGLTATSYTPATALPEGTIWWRVRTFDTAGKVGSFSAAGSFVVDLTAPAVPVLIPVTPSPTNNRRPTLAWNAVATASSYRVQVSSTSGFTSLLVDATVSTLTYQPTIDLPEGQVYWRAASLDEAGNQSAFSSAGSFVVDITPPPAITGLVAHRNGTGVDLTWNLLANPPADFARFRIYRSLSAFTNTTGVPLLDQSLTSPSAVAFRDATASLGTAYWYAVTTVDTAGNENRSVLVASVPANEAPNTPVLVAPAIGAQVLPSGSMAVALGWQGSDPENDPLRYDVYLSTDQASVSGTPDLSFRVATDLSSPSFSTPVTYQTTYYWRVAAVDLASDGTPHATTFGPVWSFAIGAIPAPVLNPVTPDPTRQPRPAFTWQTVPGAVGYHIDIDDDPAFGSLFLGVDVTQATFTPGVDLPEGVLRWRVRALDAQGHPGAFSTVGTFTEDRTAPVVGNLRVDWDNPGTILLWDPIPGTVTDVSAFRIYREDAPFSNVAGKVPAATLSDPAATRFADTGAAHGAFHYYAVTAVDRAGNEQTAVVSVATPPPGGDFYTISPCRALDTRGSQGPYGGPALAAGQPRPLVLAGRCGIPATARAVAVNITVVGATAAGFLKAYPQGTPAPTASTLNFSAGQVRGNNAILSLSQDGQATLVLEAGMPAGTEVQAVLDVYGYFE